ncbi:hypothetical protein [Aureimonas sp. ME7]|uniref:hypothetical protein n=1 Tax=Aureimonas sp. ME7 TaxID=2744252 RepID=UPI0015F75A9F|nr:hypothetical protein [Aureimonas sp. ME7]
MASIDPDVNALLDALTRGGLAELARSAAERATGVDDTEPETRGREGYVSRERQLEGANQAVVSRLKREIAAGSRIRELAAGLDLKAVVILPNPVPERPEGRPEGPEGQRDDLLDPERIRAMEALLKSWVRAEAALRERWEAERAD